MDGKTSDGKTGAASERLEAMRGAMEQMGRAQRREGAAMIRDAVIGPETMRTMRMLAPSPGGSDRRPLEVRLAGRPGSIGLCGLCSRSGHCLRKGTRRACRFPASAVAVALARWDRERERRER